MNDNNAVLNQKVEIQVGEKVIPVIDWHMDASPLDYSAPMPSPKAIADILDVQVHCEMHAEPGLFEFLQSLGSVLRETAEAHVLILQGKARNLLLKHQAYMNKAKRRHKIHRKQKRAAFRRRKRGLA